MVQELSFHRRDAEAQRKRRDLKRESPHAAVASSANVRSVRHAEEAETLRATGRVRRGGIPSPIPHPPSPSGAPQETR
jgi:hypothetical protein